VSDLRPGDPETIGQFRIRRRLGVGGMGVVFLAEGRSGPVALKVVRPELGHDPQFRIRFRREVQASFRVQSPTTVTLVDFDTEAEQPWMAVEYIDGPALSERVPRSGPLDHPQQFALAVALADALLEIHEHGLVHRDLKPDNVLLPRQGPKVIDLGIAAAVDAVRLTAAGSVLGAPGWLSPEQVETGNATAASDVFAWGCTLGYAASGRLPFGEGAPHVLFYRALTSAPDVDFGRLAPSLRSLVAAATERDPAARPSSAKLLDRLLERSDLPGPVERAGSVRQILRRDWEGVVATAAPPTPAASAQAAPKPAIPAPAAAPEADDPRRTVVIPRCRAPISAPPISPSPASASPSSAPPASASPSSASPVSTRPSSPPPAGGPLLGQGPFVGGQGPPSHAPHGYPFSEPASSPQPGTSRRLMVLGLAVLAVLVMLGLVVFLVAG
jgi:serine/threonine protein kinase